jgi:hypothetical protein
MEVAVIAEFHPGHACYRGTLAGINRPQPASVHLHAKHTDDSRSNAPNIHLPELDIAAWVV